MSCFWDCCLRNMMTLCEKANFLFHLDSFIKPRISGEHMIFRAQNLPHADCDVRSVRQPDWYVRFHQRDRPALPVEMNAGLKKFFEIFEKNPKSKNKIFEKKIQNPRIKFLENFNSKKKLSKKIQKWNFCKKSKFENEIFAKNPNSKMKISKKKIQIQNEIF